MKKIFRVHLIIILPVVFLLTCNPFAQNGMVFPDFPSHLLFVEDNHPEARVVRSGLFNHSRPVFEVYNEELKFFAGTSDGSLYLRTLENSIHLTLNKPDGNWRWDIADALWSKDGQYLWVKQIDDSEVPVIDLIKEDGETVKKPYSRAGQAIPKERYYVVNANSGGSIQVPLDESLPYIHGVSWNEEGNEILFVQSDRLMKELHVREFSVASEEPSTLFKETTETYLIGLNLLPGYSQTFREKGYVRRIATGILLQSERTGYNQLYQYDENGNLQEQLTNYSDNGILKDISGIDEDNGWVYFISNTPEDPLKTSLYRTSLTEDRTEKLLDGSTIVLTKWNDSFDTLRVLESKNPHLLEINSYTPRGELIENLWTGSPDDKRSEGYQPEYLSVQLDEPDNTAEVMILRPKGFDQDNSYPVIEYIYGGSFINAVPSNPLNNWIWTLQDIADEGYIVVIIDSRGTPGKGKEFQDHIYGRMGQVELHDHTKVIKKLAETYDHFDLERVGIIGHSWGGYFSLRGMIMYPDLYKAAHVSAPGVDPNKFRIAVEVFMGCLPQECPETYEAASVTNFAEQIKGPVQIMHGTADDDVPIEESYRLKEAFENIGKSNFELIEFPGADHIVMRDPKWSVYVKEFFNANLK